MLRYHDTAFGRRTIFRFAIGASVVAVPWKSVRGQVEVATEPVTPIRRLDDALLAAMRSGQTSTFAQRFAMLTPVVEQTFDLDAVLALSVGLGWSQLPDAEKPRLRTAFLRYTVASYAANFDRWSGQVFQVSPTAREIGNSRVIVQTKIVSNDGSARVLNYLMRNGQAGWKAVDVLENGTISRVAVQRSDFHELLETGGVPALMTALQRKVATLSGGMLA